MNRINREWHEQHRMPKNATEDERVAWHLEHARNCGCREISGGVATLLEKHGIPLPKPHRQTHGD